MKRPLVLALLLVLLPTALAAQQGSVSLGVSGGAAINTTDAQWDVDLGWGFHVNIPILATFHIAPAAELYQIDEIYATDVGLGFKFTVPLGRSGLYAGVAPGITAYGSNASPHVGGLVGFFTPVLSNISGFAQYRYSVVFPDDTNVRYSHVTAGLLFSF
ncbi:MAG: hypothetical protein ACOC1U_06855 [Spirochaetota bacterium]